MGKGVIEDKTWKDYRQRLAEFMQQINPKPTLEQVEQLRQNYLDARKLNK